MLKSTSLWAGSEAQVEYCAMARGAASARMPVTSAKCFIVDIPFGAGHWPLQGWEKRAELSPDARGDGGKHELLCAESSDADRMPEEKYSLQQT
jgi:hypothetical protein